MRHAVIHLALLCCFWAVPLHAAGYSWQEAQAEALPTGDLRWSPRPYAFQVGDVIRYIDYENGDDSNDGTSRETPWKHHPWDAHAEDQAKADASADTYIFKRGAAYRGHLVATRSGTRDKPISLISYPAWGEGEAALLGSERVSGVWTQGTDHPRIPDREKVWTIDIGTDFVPHAMWAIDVQGEETRVHLARDPNWTIETPSYPQSQWHQWRRVDNKAKGWRSWFLVDALTGLPEDTFSEAIVWTEYDGNMGAIHHKRVTKYLPKSGQVHLSGPMGGYVQVSTGNRYCIENVPAFLDVPGEFYFDKGTGRLHVRLPGDADPNAMRIELSRRRHIINITDQSHIRIAGLRFGFNDYDFEAVGNPRYRIHPACIRVRGQTSSIHVTHCRFYHVMGAFTVFPRFTKIMTEERMPDLAVNWQQDIVDDILFADNDIFWADHAHCIGAYDGKGEVPARGKPFGLFRKIRILRNRLRYTGWRPGGNPYSNIAAIFLDRIDEIEVAGNIIDMCWGTGIFTRGGRSNGSPQETPLIRHLIYQNKLTNTMLGCNDWGGIAPWMNGPIYVFNNISGNCVGHKSAKPLKHDHKTVGYPIYLDGAFKVYTFNNIAWGLSNRLDDPYRNKAGYFQVFGMLNHAVNNTFYKFVEGLAGSTGNRGFFLGNVFADMTKYHIYQNPFRDTDTSLVGGGDTGESSLRGMPDMVYGNNVFCGPTNAPVAVGMRQSAEQAARNLNHGPKTVCRTVDAFREYLTNIPVIHGQVGSQTTDVPFVDGDKHDFRLKPESEPIDKGVRHFVPWSLYAMVGEWNFYRNHNNPEVVIGENHYVTDEFVHRSMFDKVPTNPLAVPGATLADYTDGPLEDWTAGALSFDGETRFAVLPHAKLINDYWVSWLEAHHGGQVDNKGKLQGYKNYTYPGEKRRTVDMGTNSFLIEVYFKPAENLQERVLVSKHAEGCGYTVSVNERGQAMIVLASDAGTAQAASSAAVNDGAWHHLIVEVDRGADVVRMYIDGVEAGESDLDLPQEATLANTGDFFVGKAADGRFFKGAIDFLRVSRGTLQDARTTIGELYAWQFDGPSHRDFTGAEPHGRRDAGALEYRP